MYNDNSHIAQSEHQTLPVAVVWLRHGAAGIPPSMPAAVAAPNVSTVLSTVPVMSGDPVDTASTPSFTASGVISIQGPWRIEPFGVFGECPEYRVSRTSPSSQICASSLLLGLEMTGCIKVISSERYSWVNSVSVLYDDGHREEYTVDEDGFAHGCMQYATPFPLYVFVTLGSGTSGTSPDCVLLLLPSSSLMDFQTRLCTQKHSNF